MYEVSRRDRNDVNVRSLHHRHHDAANDKTSGRAGMNLTHRTLLVVLAIGMTASCAHVPRMPQASPETASLRSQFLHDHPNGPHNAQIVRGEVVKGMDLMEVLASWGVPERRVGKKSSDKESWIYTARDEHSQDYVIYELVFVDRVLSRWHIDRGTTGSGVRAGETTATMDAPLRLPSDAFASDRVVPKK
jgi:hypothetical protein